nr:MAG TPA: hypothetical protein [Caudoviricetes sp.]
MRCKMVYLLWKMCDFWVKIRVKMRVKPYMSC